MKEFSIPYGGISICIRKPKYWKIYWRHSNIIGRSSVPSGRKINQRFIRNRSKVDGKDVKMSHQRWQLFKLDAIAWFWRPIYPGALVVLLMHWLFLVMALLTNFAPTYTPRSFVLKSTHIKPTNPITILLQRLFDHEYRVHHQRQEEDHGSQPLPIASACGSG